MALIKCPECGKEISEKSTKCPSCGYPLRKEEFISNFSKKSKNILRKAQQTMMRLFEKSFLISAILYFILGIGNCILQLSIGSFNVISLLVLFVYNIGMGFFILRRNKRMVLAFSVCSAIIGLISLFAAQNSAYTVINIISSFVFVITVIVSIQKRRLVNVIWFLAGVLRLISFVLLIDASKTQSIQWQSTQWWAIVFAIMEILAMLFAGVWLKIDSNTSD